MTATIQYTPSQLQAISDFALFAASGREKCFILCGSAGTGKTTVITALLRELQGSKIPFTLAAPTGKAAMVLNSKTGIPVKTVSSLLYLPFTKVEQDKGLLVEKLGMSEREINLIGIKGHIIFVDECSMLTKYDLNAMKKVMENNQHVKFVFVGDSYQLPPVSEPESFALNQLYVAELFGAPVRKVELKEVMRQSEGSYVLEHATKIRDWMSRTGQKPEMPREKIKQVLIHEFLKSPENTKFVCYSNFEADSINSEIRKRLGISGYLWVPEEEYMCLKNRYEGKKLILANGDYFKVVSQAGEIREFFGLKLVNLNITRLGDKLEAIICIEFDVTDLCYGADKARVIRSEALKETQSDPELKKDYDNRMRNVTSFNYSYAITCHKAQGSEWDTVYIEKNSRANWNWLYTAITRAKTHFELF